ncbi:uncharacterized protein LOC110455840 isoform X2 [Mizuhopecten yessoensis]|uniref:Golgi-associated plant pathogenesis-related protein 1 n=1 Tax=Mizuhopecten yessoensis TaxID=6573 RepID=A0A210QC79_MIZYE|nr:uncharacterized protein LOC110455840 isoform X2 [Mizuhopecten yessoensis]OWF46342.1 Golgi-associated plant pathogenesis-related protein 1 [Mizuhopecten yessoensis]
MYSSKYVVKTDSRSSRPDFGEVRLAINPDKQTAVLVTPGKEGSVTSYRGRDSRSVPLVVRPNKPEASGQPSWIKSKEKEPLQIVNTSARGGTNTIIANKNKSDFTIRPSWVKESAGQKTYQLRSNDGHSDRPFGAGYAASNRQTVSSSYCDKPSVSGLDSCLVKPKGHAYGRPLSSVSVKDCKKKFNSDSNTPERQGHNFKNLNDTTRKPAQKCVSGYSTSEQNTRQTWVKDPIRKERNLNPTKLSWQRPQNTTMADQNFIDEVVKAHNNYRAKHQSGPIVHSSELTSVAQRWADHLAKTDGFQHSDCKHDGKSIGENIAMKWTSGPDNYTGQEVTDQWYSEVKMYTFGKEPTSTGTGHFTQVVWKGSDEIGVGKARTKDGKILVVANYRPAGNMTGSFRENVLPPKDGKIELPAANDAPSVEHKQGSGPFSSRFENKDIPSNMASRGGESRSVRTFTETSGSGANKVTKTVVEETIIKADGSKTTNRKETITTGDSGSCSSDMKSIGHHDNKEKDKKDKGGAFGFFKKDKKGKRSSSSSSDSSPEREKKPQKIKEFIDDAVKTHNELRKKHGVAPLKHSKDLSEFAQKWAEHLAASNGFQHSDCQHKGDRLGENIACKWSSGSADYSGKDVTDYWYSEIEKHDFNSEPRTLGSGHFTQVVWKGSKEMGIGKAKSSGGKVLVVASYRPAGNLVGTFLENVPPPKK